MTRIPERWRLVHEDHEHLVENVDAGWRRSVTWRLDGTEIGTRRTNDKRVVINGGDRGAVRVQLPEFAGPARRVTWYDADSAVDAETAARTGLGGLDLVPEPGSKAAAREAWIREHPRLYVARSTATAVLGVLLPLLLLWLASRITWPSISIPLPDWSLPSIPWPSIPWPSWDLPELPAWLKSLLEKAEYVWPVLLAFGLGHAEVKRRRRQDERRHRAAAPDRPQSPARVSDAASDDGGKGSS